MVNRSDRYARKSKNVKQKGKSKMYDAKLANVEGVKKMKGKWLEASDRKYNEIVLKNRDGRIFRKCIDGSHWN